MGYVPSGYCSAAGWLNDECRMTHSTAWERVRQARRLAELPATSKAFAAGEVNLGSMAPTALFAEPVTRLHEAIDGLAQEDLELVPAAGLGDDLRGLRSAIDRVEAEFSRRLERFDCNQMRAARMAQTPDSLTA